MLILNRVKMKNSKKFKIKTYLKNVVKLDLKECRELEVTISSGEGGRHLQSVLGKYEYEQIVNRYSRCYYLNRVELKFTKDFAYQRILLQQYLSFSNRLSYQDGCMSTAGQAWVDPSWELQGTRLCNGNNCYF